MLRNMVFALGATLIVAGLAGLLTGHYVPSVIMMVWGAMAVFGIVYERYSKAYRKVSVKAPVGKHWVQTAEQVTDKKTGLHLVVYCQKVTGERIYVPLSES